MIESQEKVSSKLEDKSNKAIAEDAKNYSRDVIREGCTQLINNTYSTNKQIALRKAVGDIRRLAREKENDPLCINLDNEIQLFVKRIEICKKYSLGNCYEYAIMALDYMVSQYPHIAAEVYSIKGGDHAFLVIGRNPNSDPNDPSAWGESCYICDPWANVVYPADQYKTLTKNFFYKAENERRSNEIEDFDEKKHQFSPAPRLNSKYIQQFNKYSHIHFLMETYQKKAHLIKNSLAKFKCNLLPIQERLRAQYGEDDAKYQVLNSKIGEVINHIQLIEDALNTSLELKGNNYLKTHQNLKESLKNMVQNFNKALSFPQAEYKALSEYKNKDFFKTKLMCFFKIPPKTVVEINSARHSAVKSNENFSYILCKEKFSGHFYL